MGRPLLADPDFRASAGLFGSVRVLRDSRCGCSVHLSFVFLKVINVNVIIIYIFFVEIFS